MAGRQRLSATARVLAVRRRSAVRTGLVTVSALLAGLAGCASSPQAADPPSEPSAPASGQEAPQIRLARLAVTGTRVEPVTGLLVSLGEGARALTPESLGEGRVSVTYVWPDDTAWGYLVVEGPAAFTGSTQSAAHAVRQELQSQGAVTTAEQPLTWEGFAQSHQLTWTQDALLPGWGETTVIDAVELFLCDEAARAYTLTAFVPRGALVDTCAALMSLCSATTAPRD
ncbi:MULTISPECIES: hypothetical protein [unclassified Actinomyces]|uniref:hypothetical protein n=1 Tax=unclassified Actinomyces TaxID=2609248 RepID=UPI002016C5B1|nr:MULTISPECIES: hypothetical protein [unclassified Actinomyces]MCL3777065.1 hypothetical protein [Actinomyces sp. AC-20-1]MCL3790285.1 hypothetical protein [Actinomyces sp. 187325]MCL3791286.1 hypothetical protein [Actinomyces sp. 186855]MCL3793789.1 hypothetical protein [Actinomyces sp. 217892]